MALSAISAVLETEPYSARPEWHRWFNPITERWWAARMVPLKDPKAGAMIVSADTYDELRTAESNTSAVRPVAV